MAHVRGLQDTGGVNGFHGIRSTAQPAKLTTKLARLDHQRGLLERQLGVWTEKLQVTRHRLSLVERQMAEIGQAVRQLVTPRHKANGRKRMCAIAAVNRADGAAAAPPHKEMNLEY